MIGNHIVSARVTEHSFCDQNSPFVSACLRARRPGSGAALRSLGGRQRRGGEAVRARAVHLRVPGGQHPKVPGRQGREGRRGRAGGRGEAHGAQMGQGPLHR